MQPSIDRGIQDYNSTFTAPRANGVGLSFVRGLDGWPRLLFFFLYGNQRREDTTAEIQCAGKRRGYPMRRCCAWGVSSIISNAVRNPPFFRPPLPASLQISFANPTNRGAAVGVAKTCRRDRRKLLKRPAVRVPVLSGRKELFSSRVAMSRN